PLTVYRKSPAAAGPLDSAIRRSLIVQSVLVVGAPAAAAWSSTGGGPAASSDPASTDPTASTGPAASSGPTASTGGTCASREAGRPLHRSASVTGRSGRAPASTGGASASPRLGPTRRSGQSRAISRTAPNS